MITVKYVRENEVNDIFKISHNDADIEDYFERYPRGQYTAKELQDYYNDDSN